ncbi:unnamed protein product [Haemonchus placei]|uniref:39S ribosomal protein L22, mitochondrial n=1 Tax=Haemonchus placei TaxID=6290 RepID=A0A0N4W4Z9_HAEPC|nr:unnamed protein product [Haemonchus placei]
MFRSVIGRIVASAAGVQVCAAGVALTDKQLSRKPDWYQKDVHALEDSLKKLGRHGFNTSPSAVNESYETLKKYAHISNVEIHWRMARALLEKSYFTKCPTERAHLVHEYHRLTTSGGKNHTICITCRLLGRSRGPLMSRIVTVASQCKLVDPNRSVDTRISFPLEVSPEIPTIALAENLLSFDITGN